MNGLSFDDASDGGRREEESEGWRGRGREEKKEEKNGMH